MNWEDVRLFAAVAEAGTLADAASEIGVSTSTLHRRIAALELDLGARLFDRNPRGYHLTPVGEAALPSVVAASEAMAGLRRVVCGHDRTAAGRVRLTVSQDLLPVIAPYLSSFRHRCAGITLDVRASGQLVDLGSDADVALRITDSPSPDAIAKRLGTIVWGRYRHCHAPEAAQWVHLLNMQRVAAIRDWQPDESSSGVAFLTSSVAQAASLAQSGPYQACLPAFVAAPNPELVPVGEPHPDRSIGLWLLIHVDLRKSARVRAFVDDALEHLGPGSVMGIL